jgi:ABC-type transport system involved in multi-copper enzyme maturation permease subunit
MMLGRVGAVARNTFREAVRNKVLYSLLVFAAAIIVSALALGQLSVHEDRRMIRDVGLFGVDVFGVLIAIFIGVNLLYKELALKTVYTILPKPIARWEFILGKWAGVMATLAVEVGVMGGVLAATLMVEGGREALDLALPKALWLLFMNVTIMTSVAVWFSSFSSPFLSGLFSLGIFVVGRSVPDLRQLAGRLGGPVGRILELCAAFLPNLQLFYPSGTSVDGRPVSVHATFVAGAYLASATAYALGYSALVLGLAMLIFQRRDFV